jgi:hypothetical protein
MLRSGAAPFIASDFQFARAATRLEAWPHAEAKPCCHDCNRSLF